MPTTGDQHHLREVERDHLPARRAEALQGRDRGALAVDEAAHRIGDADAADEQRRQADEGQELREALDVAGEARIGVERASGSPSPASGRRRFGLRRDCVERGVVDARRAAGRAGRSSARGCPAARGRSPASASCETSSRGPKPMPLGDLVGLGDEAAPGARSTAAPTSTRSPTLRSSRASSAGSATAPNAPSRSARRSAAGRWRIGLERRRRPDRPHRPPSARRGPSPCRRRAPWRAWWRSTTPGPALARKARSRRSASRWMQREGHVAAEDPCGPRGRAPR